MPTIQDPVARAELIARLRRVTPTTTPAWGTLTAPRMVCHLADQLRVALGDTPCRDVSTLSLRTIVRFIVLRTGFNAPPGKVQTVREMLVTQPSTWEADMAACEALLERLAGATQVAPHPAFGKFTPGDWGIMAWKHMDHHLRQFQV